MSRLKFGDYCLIEQNRFGGENEIYLHKVIGTSQSNGYVDIPVMVMPKETIHDEIVDVVWAVCCGVQEREIFKYKLVDVKINDKYKP